ncbi:MAG: DUF4132 domain-containing protein [Hydrogenophaga sp.]|nr:DUF4132 domain-containing protein [Hydrogenophaga sp.]
MTTTVRHPKTTANPLLARPDGSRATSAWLNARRNEAEAALQHMHKHATHSYALLGPNNTPEVNGALVSKYPYNSDLYRVLLADWHGEAVLPLLEERISSTICLRLVCTFHTDAAQALLMRHVDQPAVRAAVIDRSRRWPVDTLRRLLAQAPSRTQAAAQVLLKLVDEHPDWLAALQTQLAQAPADDAQASAERKVLERLLSAPAERIPDASPDELPPILRQPPWANRKAQPPLPMLALHALPDEAVVHWDRWQLTPPHGTPKQVVEYDFRRENFNESLSPEASAQTQATENPHCPWSIPKKALFLLGVPPQRLDAVLAAEALQPYDLRSFPTKWCSDRLSYLAVLSDGLAMSTLRQWIHPASQRTPDDWGFNSHYGSIFSAFIDLAHHFRHLGPAFTKLLLQQSLHKLQKNWVPFLNILESVDLAAWMSKVGYPSRYHRAYVQQWLNQYPACAAQALIPLAVGTDPAQYGHARHHLHWLARNGHRQAIDAQAARHGPAAVQAVAQLLAVPLECLLPDKLPTAQPKWLALHALPPLLLAGSGQAVPQAQVPAVLMCMALSKGGLPYEGLRLVEQALTPDSLSRFALALFKQWEANDSPTKDRWIFEQQGRLGNDATARALAQSIRQWRAGLNRIRAYEGLEMLAEIGTDTALMLLHGFAQQARFGDLTDRATQAIQRVANERDLTMDQLTDRTVPTLGLNERGLLVLDFGPRQFQAHLTPDLTPLLADAEGRPLKTLPKPNAQDSATQAKDAAADWKDFKKQLKTVASAQIARLENAMCQQRRWTANEFIPFFVRHPLLRTLTQRLVWAAFDASGQLLGCLRIAEDLTLVDVADEPFDLDTLPEGSHLGLPHPLELPEAVRNAWGQLLADYGIAQPFEQLARPLHTLTADELTRADLPRYADRRVGTGSLLGLENRGWKRHAGDGGMIDHFAKPVATDLVARLCIEEGEWFIAGPPPAGDVSHTLRGLYLIRSASSNTTATATPPRWAELPPIAQAEMLRDLEKMAWHTH